MILLHTLCLLRLVMRKRTIVSEPEDRDWPKDFILELPFCVSCQIFPPIAEIKKRVEYEE